MNAERLCCLMLSLSVLSQVQAQDEFLAWFATSEVEQLKNAGMGDAHPQIKLLEALKLEKNKDVAKATLVAYLSREKGEKEDALVVSFLMGVRHFGGLKGEDLLLARNKLVTILDQAMSEGAVSFIELGSEEIRFRIKADRASMVGDISKLVGVRCAVRCIAKELE